MSSTRITSARSVGRELPPFLKMRSKILFLAGATGGGVTLAVIGVGVIAKSSSSREESLSSSSSIFSTIVSLILLGGSENFFLTGSVRACGTKFSLKKSSLSSPPKSSSAGGREFIAPRPFIIFLDIFIDPFLP